jgi:ABC-type antimicrobial peptide transport system permease subunit
MFYQLKIFLRNLRCGGIYSIINIGGLATGMAAAILLFAWIYHEWSYDRFHAKETQLYVAYNRNMVDGSLRCSNWTPAVLGPALRADYPGIEGMARMNNGASFLYANGESKFKIHTGGTDPDFLTMFDFPLLKGNRETALNDPYSVILTEQAAARLFGQEDPMGKMLLVDNQNSMTVTGVMKDLPGNTLFQFEALVPMSFLRVVGRYQENWRYNSLMTLVELHPNARLDLINESIRGITRAHTNDESQPEVFLYPLGKQHLYSRFVNGVPAGGMIDTLVVFGIIAGLILLIACINFMNLSTARSEKRAKEVGVRKVMGGKRLSLIRLFLGESTLIASIAGVLALGLALLLLPSFENLIRTQLTLNFTSVWFWLCILGFILLTGLLAGSYPAFYLSAFLPVKVLKGVFKAGKASVSPRKALVVVQFTISCLLIICTLVIHRQINYGQNRELGYDKDQLIYIRLEGDMDRNYELIKQDLMNSGTAVSVTKTSSPMTAGWASTWSVSWQGKDPNEKTTFDLFYADDEWAKTVGATIIEGRDIDVYTYQTDSTAMLLNETAVKTMGFEHPIGEIISTQNRDWYVVGVIKDFILNYPYDPVAPMVVGGPAGWFNVVHIKLNGHNRMADNLERVEQVFGQYNPAYPFEYRFIDEEYARKFQNVQRVGAMATSFAVLTIFISCLGLFALVAYMAETRKKEIGIRKVLGASVASIMYLLSKEFLILVLISFAIASPVAWLVMSKWLESHAYRTNIPWWLFVVVGGMSLTIALLTVGYQAIKAATANPVKAIKSE